MGIVSFIIAHKAAELCVLFLVSEGLALIPGVKANSVFQLVMGLLKKQPEVQAMEADAK